MDDIDQMLLRMQDLQPTIPFWAKAEQLERCIPQAALWRPAESRSTILDKIRSVIGVTSGASTPRPLKKACIKY